MQNHLAFAYWLKGRAFLSLTQLPFNVNGRKKKEWKKKDIPSEFVIMIDSCVQKAGNLFQSFHGSFLISCFFVWLTWIICIVLILNSPYSCQLGARFGRLVFLSSLCSVGFLLKHEKSVKPGGLSRGVWSGYFHLLGSSGLPGCESSQASCLGLKLFIYI